MTQTRGGSSSIGPSDPAGRIPRWKLVGAAGFALLAVVVLAFQWSAITGRPRPGETRGSDGPAGAAPAGRAGPGLAAAGGAPVEREVAGPRHGPAGGPGEVRAGNLEEAARAMGTTPEELRARMEWMQTDAQALPDAQFEFRAATTGAQAADIAALLRANIQQRAADVVRWSTAPTKTASDLADAASLAILARVQDADAFAAMVASLGGDASSLPPADRPGVKALAAALHGAGIDPLNVRVRDASASDRLPMPADAPPGAMMVNKMRTGDGPPLTQLTAPTGSLFPAAAGSPEGPRRAVEVRVPLKPNAVDIAPGLASLSVTMVMLPDGRWQPSIYTLYIADDDAARALMPRRAGP